MRSQSHASTVETMEGEHRAAAEAAVHAAVAHWEEVEATAKLVVDKAAVDLQAAEAAASKQLADAKAAAEQAAGIAAEVADKAQSSALVTQSSEMKAEVEVVADKEALRKEMVGERAEVAGRAARERRAEREGLVARIRGVAGAGDRGWALARSSLTCPDDEPTTCNPGIHSLALLPAAAAAVAAAAVACCLLRLLQ